MQVLWPVSEPSGNLRLLHRARSETGPSPPQIMGKAPLKFQKTILANEDPFYV